MTAEVPVLRRAERAIVRALAAEFPGESQHQFGDGTQINLSVGKGLVVHFAVREDGDRGAVDELRDMIRRARDRAHWLGVQRRRGLAIHIEGMLERAWQMANDLGAELTRESSAQSELERFRAALVALADVDDANPAVSGEARRIARDALGVL